MDVILKKTDIHSDEDTDLELPDKKILKVKSVPVRKLKRFNIINVLFSELDKLVPQGSKKCERTYSDDDEDDEDENENENTDIVIPDYLVDLEIIKS